MMNRRLLIAASVAGAVMLDARAGAVDSSDPNARAPAGARIPGMKFVYECDATQRSALDTHPRMRC